MKGAILATVVAALGLVPAGWGAPAKSSAGIDPSVLTFNKQISSIWIGESMSRVEYNWDQGSPAKLGLMPWSCLYMMESGGCVLNGGMVAYRVNGGKVGVGFYNGRVVFVITTSPYYKSPSGIGVGSVIPYGTHHTFDGTSFSYVSQGKFWGNWVSKNSLSLPQKNWNHWLAAVRRTEASGTFLSMSTSGSREIKAVMIFRKDVSWA